MRTRVLLPAIAILLLAAFLRFHLLDAQSFWNDEGNSARLSERPVAAIIEGTASDIHPPLYYLALRGWRELAGEKEFGLRSFSAFVGVLSVAAVVGLARILNRAPASTSLLAGLVAAFSPVLVYYSQETRMYGLIGLLALLSTWAFLRWAQLWLAPDPSGGRVLLGRSAIYVLLAVAGLYTHYFFPVVLLAHSILVIVWWLWPGLATVGTNAGAQTIESRSWRPLIVWAGMVVATVLLFAPWLPIFARQIGGRSGAEIALAGFVTEAGRWLSAGVTAPPELGRWTTAAGLLLLLAGLAAGRRKALVPLTMAAVGLVAMFAMGATDPAYFKFLLVVVPFLCVLAGLAALWTHWARAAVVVAVVVLLAGSGRSLANMYFDPVYARADYRSIAARVAAEGAPAAAVLLNGPNQWEVFTYYHRDGAPVYPLPRGQPDPTVLEPELAEIAAQHARLYALYWGDQQRDPERVIERWLDAHAFTVSEEWVGDVRLVTYALSGSEPPPEPAVVDATFSAPNGDAVALESVAVWPDEQHAGQTVQVRLHWRARGPTAGPYKVFVHLVDGDGRLVAQHDAEPGGGSRPATGWSPGETIVDNHGLLIPADTAAGELELVIGLYDAFDPAARMLVDAGGNRTDSLSIGAITVVE